MRYFFDTEFHEDGRTIDLISIGIVAEDGREFYAISSEFDEDRAAAHHWLPDNVLCHLDGPRQTRAEIREGVLDFVGSDTKPEFWAYYADYDWVAFCQLFGTMMDLPPTFPMFCRDLQQAWRGEAKPADPIDEHHALADARWNLEFARVLGVSG